MVTSKVTECRKCKQPRSEFAGTGGGPEGDICLACNALEQVTDVSMDNWEAILQAPPSKLWLYFWAPWCQPCRKMSVAIMSVMQQEIAGLHLAKIDMSEMAFLGAKHQVTHVPTQILISNGVEVARLIGIKDHEAIVQWLTALDD